MVFVVLSLLLVAVAASTSAEESAIAVAKGHRRATSVLSDESIRSAVNEWCRDPMTAEETYGEIHSWDTSAVTDMSGLFADEDFVNAGRSCTALDTEILDIASWDISQVTNFDRMFYNMYTLSELGFGGCLDWDLPGGATTTDMFAGNQGFIEPLFLGNLCHCKKHQFWVNEDHNGGNSDDFCVDCPYPDNCNGDNVCYGNTIGVACAACHPGFFRINTTCRKCPDWARHAWVFGILFAVAFCTLAYYLSGGEDVDLSTFSIATNCKISTPR